MRSITTRVILLASLLLCGISPAAAIIGGEPAVYHDYPYIVSFYAHGDPNDPTQRDNRTGTPFTLTQPPIGPDCTGALLPKNVVLTAASCVWNMDRKKARVAVGPAGNQTFYPFGQVHWHLRFNRRKHKHDIAIVTFDGKHNIRRFAKLSYRWPKLGEDLLLVAPRAVRLMTEANANSSAPTQTSLEMDSTQARSSNISVASLRRINVQVITNRICRPRLRKWNIFVRKDKFCTTGCTRRARSNRYTHYDYHWPTIYHDIIGASSSSDTGAPLLLHGAVVGILTIGPPSTDDDIRACTPRAVTDMNAHMWYVKRFYDEHLTGRFGGRFRDFLGRKGDRDPWSRWPGKDD
ncbi:hypothetical protein E4U55_001544 [Claviceps digitariae]|nr:hypothetical protein E4U55_001544 [Claviceps digitariae]